MKTIALLVLNTLALFAMPFAHAEDALTSSLEARKVIRTADGTEKFAPAASVTPNDVVEYRNVYRNNSTRVLRDIAATLPIPVGFEFIEARASSKALASLDGKSYGALPLTRVVKTAKGEQTEVVPLSEYRFLRWQLGDLAPGASTTVSARVRLTSERSVVAAEH